MQHYFTKTTSDMSNVLYEASFSGFWRILDFDYLFRIVSHITNLVQERGWPLDAIPHDKALEELSKLEPRTVMTQCLEYYLEPMHTDDEDGKFLTAG